MATIPLPPDFSAFLRLLSEHEVKYLLIGGYAVGYHGYVRATADMDIWLQRDRQNAERAVEVLEAFGFRVSELKPDLFLRKERIVRLGLPPMQIELLTSVSGVEFDDCYASRIEETWDDVTVNIISLEKLKENKRASGRLKDLNDLDHLD
ncbi:MAG TPA: hypothetical protein VKP65_14900 [Rhodothermales bacterium]|nr:hypothetical protein [Rhodothermales bacterium]